MGIIEHVADRTARRPRRLARALAAGACAAGLVLGVSGCGFDAQTLQPYTPAQGVNVDVGDGPNQQPAVQVRGLVLITDSQADAAEAGFLSAALYASEDGDTLTDVSGVAIGTHGEPVGELDVTPFEPLAIDPTDLPLVLIDQPAIQIGAPGIFAGGTVELTLTFQQAGATTLRVPVVDGSDSVWAEVTPQAATASPTPAG